MAEEGRKALQPAWGRPMVVEAMTAARGVSTRPPPGRTPPGEATHCRGRPPASCACRPSASQTWSWGASAGAAWRRAASRRVLRPWTLPCRDTVANEPHRCAAAHPRLRSRRWAPAPGVEWRCWTLLANATSATLATGIWRPCSASPSKIEVTDTSTTSAPTSPSLLPSAAAAAAPAVAMPGRCLNGRAASAPASLHGHATARARSSSSSVAHCGGGLPPWGTYPAASAMGSLMPRSCISSCISELR